MPIDFSQYTVNKFVPHLYDRLSYESISGCGACALATLTGDNPLNIKKKNKNKDHFSDRFIKNYLEKNGFKVIRIKKKDIINRPITNSFKEQIHDNHVLLTSQQLTKKNASWMIYWNNLVIHNFSIIKQRPFDAINFPILSSYLLYHPKYRVKYK